MAIKIVADVHGEYGALAGQLRPDDTAVLLGDYLNLIDFRTLDGILAEVYTREEIIAALSALARGDKQLAHRSIQEIAGGSPGKFRRVRELVEQGYSDFFGCLPCESIMIYGNTDNPQLMKMFSGDGAEIVEAGVRVISGHRFAFVSGSPHGPWTVGLPGEMEPGRYRELVESLGPADVLCSHCPPAVPGLTWDSVADRDEPGSEALLEYVDKYQPKYHYFGHVHNPRLDSAVRGTTRLVNAGFFKQHKRALVCDLGPAA